MFRKISMMLSLVGVLGLGLAIAVPSSSFAKDAKQSSKGGGKNVSHKSNVSHKGNVSHKSNVSRKSNVHHVQRTTVVHRNVVVKNNYVYGRRYNGHVWYGHNRHRWRGNWYAYGVGPCWVNVDGLFFWNVAVCT
jgi:hypothetical protein